MTSSKSTAPPFYFKLAIVLIGITGPDFLTIWVKKCYVQFYLGCQLLQVFATHEVKPFVYDMSV